MMKWEKTEAGKEYHRNYGRNWMRKNKEKAKFWKQRSKDKNPILFRLDSFHRRGRKTGQKCNLTKEWAEKEYTGFCSLSKLPFITNKGQIPFSASVDRIDNKKGYTIKNSRIILHGLNLLKGVGSDEDMYLIAYGLIKNLTKEQKSAIKTRYNILIKGKY